MTSIDLTAITTPLCLLDEATRRALKAHGGPYEFCWGDGWRDASTPSWTSGYTYRVKPSPKRGTAQLQLYYHGAAYPFTIDLIDGEPDWSSIKPGEIDQ